MREMGEFRHVKISARLNFGHYFGPTQAPTPANRNVTRYCRTIRNGTLAVTVISSPQGILRVQVTTTYIGYSALSHDHFRIAGPFWFIRN